MGFLFSVIRKIMDAFLLFYYYFFARIPIRNSFYLSYFLFPYKILNVVEAFGGHSPGEIFSRGGTLWRICRWGGRIFYRKFFMGEFPAIEILRGEFMREQLPIGEGGFPGDIFYGGGISGMI